MMDTVLTCLRGWQREAADRYPSRENLILPDREHSLLKDNDALERFLGELLRIYDDVHIERWLTDIVQDQNFVEKARQCRSFRLIALWLICVFRRGEMVSQLREILGDPESACRTLEQDRNGLAGTPWEGWLDGWAEQLRLKSLKSRDQRFAVGPLRQRATEERVRTTVIIPSYNHEIFIGDAIRSVLAQTRTDFRLLIVDDASQDGTVNEAEKIKDPRIRVRRNPENLGLGLSLARALENVETEFVAFLNSDDLFEPRRLEYCLAKLEESTELALVGTGLAPIDSNGRICSATDSSPVFDGQKIHNWLRWYKEHACMEKSPPDLLSALLERNFLITTSNLVARTEFVQRYRHTWQNLEFCVDWQIFLLAAFEKKLCYLPGILLGYRLHQANTVWFDADRSWRYYLEVNQVMARFLAGLSQNAEMSGAARFSAVISAVTDHAVFNTNVDWPGVCLGLLLERLHLHPRGVEGKAVAERLKSLDTARNLRLESVFLFQELAKNTTELYRMKGEYPFLRSIRNRYEALQGDHERLREEMTALVNRANAQDWVSERNRLLHSPERQLGDLLLNRLRLRRPLTVAHHFWLALHHRFVVAKLTLRAVTNGGATQVLKERLRGTRHSTKWKAVVAATGRFPIYSHTFVYQELMGLHEMGLDVRLFYWIRGKREAMHAAYLYLLKNSVQLQSIREDHVRDMKYWKNTHAGRLEDLLEKIARATDRTPEDLEHDYEIMQACTFARMAEQAGADYVHTYFFYEQSLFGMVTAWLLGIPRGITAYADHMLNDYPFKLVPLHLETADVVVATSQRIRRELVQIAGDQFAEKILVKPNGVDGRRFSFQQRMRNSDAFEVISVSRIEPKKGLLTLVETGRLLLDRGRPIKFHIVGTADPGCPGSVEFAEEFYALIRNQGVSEYFVLHGYKNQEELIPLLNSVHAFVAPYVETVAGDKDGIPTALLEAMATGLPSVTTGAGSVLEVVDNGVEALIVPQQDPARLADALQRLMDDPVLSTEMGRRARERFDRQFDYRVTEKKLHDKIGELLEKRCAATPIDLVAEGIR